MLAKLHVKQLLNTSIPVGSVILSTASNADWTSNSTGALLLPVGTGVQQPSGIDGYLRVNTTTNALEVHVNGGWQTVSSGPTAVTAAAYKNANITVDGQGRVTAASSGAFTGLADAPTAYTGAGGQFVQVNSGATALQFYPGMMIQRFTFDVQFSGTSPLSIANSPSGWTISIAANNITVQHNLGRQPIQVWVWGQATSVLWTQRAFGSTALNLNYVDGNTSTVTMSGFSTTNTAAGSGLKATVVLFFTSV